MNFTKRLTSASSQVVAVQNTNQAAKFIKNIFAKNGVRVNLHEKAEDSGFTLAHIYFNYRDPVFKTLGSIGFSLVKGKILVESQFEGLFRLEADSLPEGQYLANEDQLGVALKHLDRDSLKFDIYLERLKKYQAWCESFYASLEQINSLVVKK